MRSFGKVRESSCRRRRKPSRSGWMPIFLNGFESKRISDANQRRAPNLHGCESDVRKTLILFFSRRSADLLSATRRALGEPVSVSVTECVACDLVHACSADRGANRSDNARPPADPAADAAPDRRPEHGGADPAAALAADHPHAASDTDSVEKGFGLAASLAGRVTDDRLAALLPDPVQSLGVVLQLARRLEALSALLAPQVLHSAPPSPRFATRESLQKRCPSPRRLRALTCHAARQRPARTLSSLLPATRCS